MAGEQIGSERIWGRGGGGMTKTKVDMIAKSSLDKWFRRITEQEEQ